MTAFFGKPTTPIRAYPILDEAVAELIASWYPDLSTPEDDPSEYRVGQKFPNRELFEVLPFVRVRDIGGNDDGLTDTPLIDIDVFHSTYAEVRDLAMDIQARLLRYPHRVGTTIIDEVHTAMRPHDVPWDDERISRFYSSYLVSARR